ncbi:protein-S-isoprenylcysteine methyltransferase [Lysobacteraceae bacterium NML120232]|nr:protein-S-isoprenylcysteine methyltransferase [Xanthomonadaceae bacterium NML08-0793]PJK11932.1 protein-S-isoprenylcysteine methyltransferase [Xanthomonadaceae bacterium NML120232]
MRALELKIPPLLLVAILAAAMYAITRLTPQWVLPLSLPMKASLAAVWVATGVVIAMLGVRAFRRHRTSVNPVQPDTASQIVSTGIFAHSRNPMYLGMVCCLMGWGLWLAHPLALPGVPLAVIWLHFFQIKPEERILLQKFGEPYAEYLRRVRRWC